MAELLDGKRIADTILDEVRNDVVGTDDAGRRPPGLAVVLVGGDPASLVYVGLKVKKCAELGFHSQRHDLPESTTTSELLALIAKLNADHTIDGILVQLPLPKHIAEQQVLDAIEPQKDVDGFHPINVGLLYLGQEQRALTPCTPTGVIELLQRSNIPITGTRAVVIGRSTIVGKPMAALLINRSATVTVCHSKTVGLSAVCREADLLIAAIGKPGFVTDEFIKPGATVIDVGINPVTDVELARDYFGDDAKRFAAIESRGHTLVGDVHPRLAAPVAGRITPVPGGVGPLTIAMLLKNTLKAYRLGM